MNGGNGLLGAYLLSSILFPVGGGACELSAITTTTTSSSITSSWTLPSGCTVTSVLVVRKVGSAPVDMSDGSSSGIVINAGLDGFQDSGLTLGAHYFYRIQLNGNSVERSISAIPGTVAYQPGKVANGSITVDGVDDETVWSSMPKIDFSFNISEYSGLTWPLNYTSGNDDSTTGYVRMAYDDSNLYVFIRIYDKYLVANNSASVWLDDSIELFFDMGREQVALPDTNDYQLIFVVNNNSPGFSGVGDGSASYDSSWNPALTAMNRTSASGGGNGTICTTYDAGGDVSGCAENGNSDLYRDLEIQIPFSELGGASISTGDWIGFDFYINDDDLIDSNIQHYYRPNSGTVYNQPSTWGIIQF